VTTRRRQERPCRRAGFTLIEVLLAITLVLVLITVSAISVGAWKRGQDLKEGSQNLMTALRMARADAANRGKRLRLVFSPADGQTQLLWEPDPLTKPGVFVDYTVCTWKSFLANPDVQVRRCDFTGSSTYRTLAADTATTSVSDQPTMAPITFEPDGSCDSVIIEMVATDASITQHAIIELEGLTGRVMNRIESYDASTPTVLTPTTGM
jgi:prepilin-type N-terminal cleavage/methylation domain-containing protein